MTQPPLPLGAVLGFRDACDHAGAVLSRCAANGGIGLWCDSCRSWATRAKYDRQWLGKDHEALRGIDLSQLPEVGARIYRKCQGACGQLTQCELHHTAPRAFFGDECDQWPILWLCRACHDRWHAKLTPGLCTQHDAEKHAEQLIRYLGLEHAAELTKYLIAIGRARRARVPEEVPT